MYYNGRQFSNFRGINLLAANGALRLEDVDTAPTTTTGEYVIYVDGGVLYWDNGSTITALGAAGGSGGASWEAQYAADNTINIAGGSGLTIAGAMANANDVLTITQTSDGSGDALQITNSGSGNDISGTSGAWSITKAGVATFAEVVLTSTVSTDVMAITNNSITANNAFIVTGSGVFTGTGANSFANVTQSGLTTGTAFTVIANAATTSVGVVDVSATAMSSGSTARITGGGANITAGGKVLEVAMGAATTGAGVSITTSGIHTGTTTNSLLAINATSATAGTALYVQVNGLTTGVAQLITSSGTMTTTGSLLTLTANSATTAAGIFRIDANGLTSGIGAVIASSATAITGAGRLLRVDHIGATGTTAILSEFASAANDETVIVKITASSLLAAGVALDISAAAMTTGKAIDMSDLDAITTGKAIHVDATGITQTSGILVHLDSAGTVITGAGRIFLSDHTGATTTSGVLNEFITAATDETVLVQLTTAAMIDGVALKIDGTTGMTTGSLVRVASSTAGALATNGVVSLTATGAFTSTSATNGGFVEVKANTTTAGTIINVTGTALTTGIGMHISNGTAATTSGSLLRVTAGGVGAVATNGIISFVHTGLYTSAAATLGMFHVAANTTTAGTVASVSGTGVVGGTVLVLDATAATLTTGKYLSAHDAAGEVFGIGANGHIHSTVGAVAPTIAVTTALGITAAAITSGGSDVCGIITTTGTSTGATVLDVTFNKTYTTAPKAVILTPANAAAAMPNSGYFVSAITATTFTITVVTAGTYAATPSWRYLVVA